MRTILVAGFALFFAACGATQSSSEEPASEAPEEQEAPSASGDSTASSSPGEPTPPYADVTAEQCQASGGSVVGDIGDGAIHRPDYRCPSGAAPSGNIIPNAGGPIAIEGAVCCPE